jgi:hypothetical protein
MISERLSGLRGLDFHKLFLINPVFCSLTFLVKNLYCESINASASVARPAEVFF